LRISTLPRAYLAAGWIRLQLFTRPTLLPARYNGGEHHQEISCQTACNLAITLKQDPEHTPATNS
jgi:hypothetical protein